MKKTFVILLLFLSNGLLGQEDEQKFTLYFDNDVSELNAAHLAIIDSIKFSEEKHELDVHIKGYTNAVGDFLYNVHLSEKRAKNVQSLLREFTIISSKGYGELASDAASNRRVDILVHHKKDHIATLDEIVILPKISTPVATKINRNTQFKIGDKLTLEGIMFYKDRDVIMDESRDALDNLVAFLEKNTNVKFKLIGHICCGHPSNPATDLLNKRTGRRNLSEARAKSVYSYLAKKGIKKHRMRYIGMAYKQPKGKDNILDRRVEIEITDID
ncbi:OmpA family protein [Patiriisocius sp. Uisw_017]|uniref:OmpA family protein n=1 Tax=Patiriisocius sp. Uisw_017 TaxID=3230968 RepID=UPI0039EB130A